MKIISLGWGVQSFTLAAMSALGELERVDAAVHADTTHERQATYHFAFRWTDWLFSHGVRVETVRARNLLRALDEYGACMIPAYIDGHGVFSRQCTDNWKRAPLRRWLQANRNGEPVELWLGISTDEALRMKPSDVKYITHRWPLIELKMSRVDCVEWLKSHFLKVPSKSSCVFCPYQNTAEWRQVRNSPADWSEAVLADNEIRKARPPYDLFVHPSRVPLEGIDFRKGWQPGQMSMWDEECSGMCGL